jgi:hypothetical protein
MNLNEDACAVIIGLIILIIHYSVLTFVLLYCRTKYIPTLIIALLYVQFVPQLEMEIVPTMLINSGEQLRKEHSPKIHTKVCHTLYLD